MIEFFVPGIPQPQGNHRVSRSGYVYDANPKLRGWRDAVTAVARAARRGRDPIDYPVAVEVYFLLPKPKKPTFDLPAVSPDLDKLQRALGDGLEASGLLKNDSRVVAWNAQKLYAARAQQPGAQVTLLPADNLLYPGPESASPGDATRGPTRRNP